MLNVKIGGVPEHFNLPWYLKLKDGSFKSNGINLRWKDCHGGTGEMCTALRSNNIDIAVILTEGIVKDIIDGNPSKIVQTYVSSPLIWGIHTGHDSKFNSIKDLKGTKAAISRLGSGSHLMAFVNAESNGWDVTTDLNFEIVHNLDGGVSALVNQKADYFLWEAFTTKPFVDKGILRKIGECPTPWPCFVIAVTEQFLTNHPSVLKSILRIINDCTKDFKSIPNIDLMISQRYSQKIEDVRLWLSLTDWAQKSPNEATISKVQDHLQRLEIITNRKSYSQLVQTV